MSVTPEQLAAMQAEVKAAQDAAKAAEVAAAEAKAQAAAAASGGQTTPPPADNKTGLEKDLYDTMAEKAPKAFEHVKELRAEAERKRIEKMEAEAEAMRVKAELASLKLKMKSVTLDDETVKQTVKSVEDKKNDEIKQTKNELYAVQKRLIDAELTQIAVQEQVPSVLLGKIHKLIDRTGLGLDESGNVIGAKEAVARFKQENAEIIEAIQKGAPAQQPNVMQRPPIDPNNPTSYMLVPGTGITYDEYARLTQGTTAPAKEPPPGNGRVEQKPFNALTATKEESEAYFRSLKHSVRGK